MIDYIWIRHLLNSNISDDVQKQLHGKDVWNTWFGVPYYQDKPQLYTYPRLQNLIEQFAPSGINDQFPSLVSFFGDTGGGKSTIIRSLINNAGPNATSFDTPVPGTQSAITQSTSGDVHLYADPISISTEVPLFYAGT